MKRSTRPKSVIRVLVVDDDEADARATLGLLEGGVHTHLEALWLRDPDDALEAMREGRVDVCLLDYRVGGCAGLGMLRSLRSSGVEVPVIVLTGTSDRSVDLVVMECGAADALEKGSVDAPGLERAIRHAIVRSRYERELAHRNERLERLDAEKNQLLGMAAHDLRNPLGVVYGYSSLLATDLETYSPDEVREMIQIIARSSAFMRGLIDDLLDLASIESGTLRLTVVPTDPVELARKNVALNQILASAKSIEIQLEAEPDTPLVDVDDARFDQVLNNLLSNAVKYSSPGSHVTVHVGPRYDGALFAVVDQGRGIAPEFLESIFRPFTKEEATGTAGEKSTGLGLAIVKRIVDAHGGRLTVTSEPGHGSTFSVWLPAHGPRGAP